MLKERELGCEFCSQEENVNHAVVTLQNGLAGCDIDEPIMFCPFCGLRLSVLYTEAPYPPEDFQNLHQAYLDVEEMDKGG